MSSIDLTIKVDRAVTLPLVDPPKVAKRQRKRSRSARIQGYVDKFAAFKPGDSFFVEGVKRTDLEFLRTPFKAAGLGMVMREIECDEVYGVAGVRVWRQPGEYDEL